jgi:hypothetical protein
MTEEMESYLPALTGDAKKISSRAAFSALFAEMHAAFDHIEAKIRLAGQFELFSIKLHGCRALTPKTFKFVMEWDEAEKEWRVGYFPLRSKSRKAPIVVADPKLDGAVDLLFGLWQQWAEGEKASQTSD